MDRNTNLIMDMIDFNSGNPDLIQHFLKVHQFAKIIGITENISREKMEILEASAIVHDIGIKVCMEKYGKSTGNLQEKEGPAYAKELLIRHGYSTESIDRVCFLVAHHHTYTDIDDIDYQILIEADFLVNLYENSCDEETIKEIYRSIFKTKTGRKIFMQIFMKNNIQIHLYTIRHLVCQ